MLITSTASSLSNLDDTYVIVAYAYDADTVFNSDPSGVLSNPPTLAYPITLGELTNNDN